MPVKLALSVLPLLVLFSGCDLINKKEDQPVYIEVSKFKVSTEQSTQGSNSDNITDAWIYIDGQALGAFELPCRVPALYTGVHTVLIGPGIKINGVSSLRAPYPFYRFYRDTLNFVPGTALKIDPVTSYSDSLNYSFLANFDDLSGNKLEATNASDTSVSITNNPEKVFEGNGSFQCNLFRNEGYTEFQMVEAIPLPKQGTLVYLELNYKTNQPLTVLLKSYYGVTSAASTFLINLNKTTSWKKVYINLTQAVSNEVSAVNHRIAFTCNKPGGSEPLEILLDNMKIIN
jgi:hypothetical protein